MRRHVARRRGPEVQKVVVRRTHVRGSQGAVTKKVYLLYEHSNYELADLAIYFLNNKYYAFYE